MELDFKATDPIEKVFTQVETYLGNLSLSIAGVDAQRPWGGFFVIDPTSENRFINEFFSEIDEQELKKYGSTISPKILVVAPGQRLSWQYHNRRAELWKVISGPVGVITSDTDEQGQLQEVNNGENVQFGPNVRHRLVGLTGWGVVAEIWQHTDSNSPSDESDIVRLEDDYARS